MDASKLLSFFFLLYLSFGFAQVPSNNECVNAEVITVSTTSPLSIAANFTNATESLDASCNIASTDNKDLWYQFTMPIDGILYINGASSLNFFTLYDSCGGTEIACSQDDSSFENLINGTTYLLRASFQFNNLSTFTIQAFEPAANDACDNRETISVVTTNFTQYSVDSRAATESMDASCDNSVNTNLDLWYEFEMPVTGNIEIKEAQQFRFLTFSIFDTCGGVELDCVYDRGFFSNLIAGTSYVLRIGDRDNNAGPINFRIQAFEFAANDECTNSDTIIVETETSNTYQADMRTATESLNASCESESNINYDLWFNFTMPVTGNLKIDQISGADTATVYDSCSGAEISCQSGLQFISGLVSGTNYTLRIASVNQANKTPRFRAFPIAPNDECTSSETISVLTSNSISYQVDTRRASETLDSSCDNVNDNNLDLWYDFVMPVTGNVQISGVAFTFRTTLYDACSGNELDCLNGNGTYFNLGINTNYKLRVSQLPNAANSANFNIQAFENLFNDDCSTPLPMTFVENEFSTYTTNNAAATNSTLSACEPSNENFTIQDVWYRFTMPSDNDVEIDHLTSNINGYYALYDSCGSTELQCITNDGFFNDLTGGNEYLLKVGKLSSQAGELSFNISAKSETLSTEELTTDVIHMYPNPFETILHISEVNGKTIQNVAIYDMTWRLVKQILNPETGHQITLDLTDLQSAIYLMVISSNNEQMTQRIIKK